MTNQGATSDDGEDVTKSGRVNTQASDSHLDLIPAPYILYGVKYVDLVSFSPFSGGGRLHRLLCHGRLGRCPLDIAYGVRRGRHRPVLAFAGASRDTVEMGASYTDAGVTADGGEAVVESGNVDTSTVEVYTITYYAEDAYDNSVTATRTVNVVDTTAPTRSES